MKRIMACFLAIMLCFSMVSTVHADCYYANAESSAEMQTFLWEFFDVYFSARETLQMDSGLNDFIEVNENTVFMLKNMEYWIEYCKVFTESKFNDFQIDAVNLKDVVLVEGVYTVVVYINYSYYINAAEAYESACGELFQLELIPVDHTYKIISFDSNSDDYLYRKELLAGSLQASESNVMHSVTSAYEIAVQNIENEKATYDAWVDSWETEELS